MDILTSCLHVCFKRTYRREEGAASPVHSGRSNVVDDDAPHGAFPVVRLSAGSQVGTSSNGSACRSYSTTSTSPPREAHLGADVELSSRPTRKILVWARLVATHDSPLRLPPALPQPPSPTRLRQARLAGFGEVDHAGGEYTCKSVGGAGKYGQVGAIFVPMHFNVTLSVNWLPGLRLDPGEIPWLREAIQWPCRIVEDRGKYVKRGRNPRSMPTNSFDSNTILCIATRRSFASLRKFCIVGLNFETNEL
ncbi:hypothetical protein FB45DRAFT_60542 [Roridomyces roridus]|uniref:Uncharacterized protein n=1 Tax=Roridomyces roridus TaxID=1738132 RepID=A0AAD7BQ97_9AGAR|nr:hypothetical protein FB45DRAFT_60542 [Roridomyces roridus]